MKLKDLCAFAIEQGIEQDLRGAAAVRAELARARERYEKLDADERKEVDPSTLENPYADSRILWGDPDTEVRTVLVGIDIESAEIVLANALRSSGKKVDLVITHHPEGVAYANFYQVMGLQTDVLNKFGVPIAAAESLTRERMNEVSRSVLPQNHMRAVDAARLLGIPFMGAHTVADNHVAMHLQKLMDQRAPLFVKDVIKVLKELPEYQDAVKIGAGPTVVSGGREDRAGKVFVDMTGGTEGSREVLEKLADAGVGTMVCMHMSEKHLEIAKKSHLRVVIAGHIASDNVGLNLLFDAVEKKFGQLEFLECSGFRRFRRT